jgi:undecaprenyl diphosphate synthase
LEGLFLEEIKMGEKTLPRHVAFIMDGNGRWAKKRFLPRIAGHKAGVEALKKVIRYSSKKGIKYVTVYAFSTENWQRPESEVKGILELLVTAMNKEFDELIANDVKIKMLGIEEDLPGKVKKAFNEAEEKTKNNKGLQFNIAFNYGSRKEIIHSVKEIAELINSKTIAINDIDEKMFESFLYTKNIPDPDLVIRTSGEVRLSNFLLWQISYSELYFTDTYWPDFNEKSYQKALDEYSNRKRRFGSLKE